MTAPIARRRRAALNREGAAEIERPKKVTDAMVRAGVAAATKAMWKAPDDAPAQETIIRAALEAALNREVRSMMIVPNCIRNEINRRLDAEIAKHPPAEKDREALYHQLLQYVNEHGVVPDFSLAPKEPKP